MPVALASLIEGNWRTLFVLLFVRGFNPYNVYALVYGTLTCGEISIIPYLVYWIKDNVRIFILICIIIAHQYFFLYFICVRLTIFFFKLVIFVFFFACVD